MTRLALWSVVLGAALGLVGPGNLTASDEPQVAAQASHGLYLFETYCATCHGKTAQGNGPLADSMRKRPPDLTKILKRHNGLFPAEKVMRIIDGREKVPGHGGPDMPVWGDAFKRSIEGDNNEQKVRDRIKAIVDYLETIQARDAQ